MLMQPQSPNPDFDFMLKENQPAKRGLPLPNFSKPVKIIIAVLVAVALLIVISSVLSGRQAGQTQPFIDILARGQETLRVTSLVQQLQLQDPQTQALAATVSSALASDKQQLTDYLAKNHNKISPNALGADDDKAADANFQTADQNNNLDSTYVTYMRDALTKYENDLKAAYNSAGPNGKAILNSISVSTTTLLNSPPLKT